MMAITAVIPLAIPLFFVDKCFSEVDAGPHMPEMDTYPCLCKIGTDSSL